MTSRIDYIQETTSISREIVGNNSNTIGSINKIIVEYINMCNMYPYSSITIMMDKGYSCISCPSERRIIYHSLKKVNTGLVSKLSDILLPYMTIDSYESIVYHVRKEWTTSRKTEGIIKKMLYRDSTIIKVIKTLNTRKSITRWIGDNVCILKLYSLYNDIWKKYNKRTTFNNISSYRDDISFLFL